MGYSRYFTVSDKKKFDDDFIEYVKTIIEVAEKDFGVKIGNGHGVDKPIIEKTRIYLNGDAAESLDHETFYIDLENPSWNFCKTNRKPYDIVVNLILQVAEYDGYVYNVSSDGDNAEDLAEELYNKVNEVYLKKHPDFVCVEEL